MRLKKKADVLVVGGGPVGLFAAVCLAERGVKVEVIDKEWRGSVHSYALALHPHTLRLLDEVGLARELIDAGHRVERVAFYDADRRVAELNIADLGDPYPYVLVVPQSTLEGALEKHLARHKISVFWNHQAMRIHREPAGVRARVAKMEKFSMGYPISHTEWMITAETDVRARFLIGADGYHSFVRNSLDARFEHQGTAETYAVFEFPAPMEFHDEARVVFHEGTTNVVWPIDGNRGRWSFQVDKSSPPAPEAESLRVLLRERAPWFQARIEDVHWATTALFERRLAEPCGRDAVWLLGDAAHVTGPVGTQSMNVGLREAKDLAGRIASIISDGAPTDVLASYEGERRLEWRRMLGIERRLEADDASSWSAKNAARILPCVPASEGEMKQLLGQLGLRHG